MAYHGTGRGRRVSHFAFCPLNDPVAKTARHQAATLIIGSAILPWVSNAPET